MDDPLSEGRARPRRVEADEDDQTEDQSRLDNR